MRFSEALEIRPGVTAIIGGGGKTTLLRTLGEELADTGRVLLCTTTKIFPFAGLPCARTAAELVDLAASHRLLCAGTPLPESGKLTTAWESPEALAARFDYVLVEADGSAGRPLKAHLSHEPVLPAAGQVICVVGASGIDRPIYEVVHRSARFAALAGASETDLATPERIAAVLTAEGLHEKIYVNQVETPARAASARRLTAALDGPALAGSLWRGEIWTC